MKKSSFNKAEYSSTGANFAPSSRTAKNTCVNMSTVGAAVAVSALFFLPMPIIMPEGIIMMMILLITLTKNITELNR